MQYLKPFPHNAHLSPDNDPQTNLNPDLELNKQEMVWINYHKYSVLNHPKDPYF